MKKNFYFLFLIISNFCFSQKYEFDLLSKYSSSDSKHKNIYETVSYNNTDDFSYHLKLNKTEQIFSAELSDYTRNLVHHFAVEESKEKGQIQFQFKYLNTSKVQVANKLKNYRYEFSDISTDSQKIVQLKIFSSKNSKNPMAEKIFNLEKANKNLIPIFSSNFLHFYADSTNVSNLGNYIVSKSVEKSKNNSCEIVLKDYKTVALEIILPDKLTYSSMKITYN